MNTKWPKVGMAVGLMWLREPKILLALPFYGPHYLLFSRRAAVFWRMTSSTGTVREQ